ncbi:MAG: hypothetical protein H8D80_01760 [Proteobacteria bacterium]|nr:hypothetical protein [Pseudomonadota bacterium]
MANIEERIKSMQEAVENAKRGVRATMTMEELSRESIRDIIKEVSETNTALDTIFKEEGKTASVNTRHLRSELTKLIEEGGDASKERLKEIEQKAKDIAQVALEESPEEAEYLGQLAANVQGAARKARGTASGLGGNVIGESLFTGIFGKQFGGWLLSPGQKRGRRGRAETLLNLRQNELNEFTYGGGGETPSEIAEEKREQEIRQVEVERKEDTVITLLNKILHLLGRNGVSDSSSGGNGDAGGSLIPAIATTAAVTIPTTAVVATKGGRQFVKNMFSWMRHGSQVTREFSTLSQRPISNTIAKSVLNQAGSKTASVLSDVAIHIGADGTKVTIGKDGVLRVRNAAGQFIKNPARYLKNLGLPLAMPPGSTIDDVFKIATRGLSKNISKSFFQRFITGFGKAGLKSAAAAEGIWAVAFAVWDAGTGATSAYEHVAAGGDLGLQTKNIDRGAGLYAGANVVHGLNWFGELVGLPGSGQSTTEVAQGIEASIFGTDLSDIYDNVLINQAKRRNRKKDLDQMAGGFDTNSDLGKRFLYTGQLMKLLISKRQNPDMEHFYVDVDGSPRTKKMSWQEAYNFLVTSSAHWIEEEEATRNNRDVSDENIKNIESALKSGNFQLQGTANSGGVSLIPWTSYDPSDSDGRVMYSREIQRTMRTSGGNWTGILGDLSEIKSFGKIPNLYPYNPAANSDRPKVNSGPVLIDASSNHNTITTDDFDDFIKLREVDPNTVNMTLD